MYFFEDFDFFCCGVCIVFIIGVIWVEFCLELRFDWLRLLCEGFRFELCVFDILDVGFWEYIGWISFWFWLWFLLVWFNLLVVVEWCKLMLDLIVCDMLVVLSLELLLVCLWNFKILIFGVLFSDFCVVYELG